MYNFLMFYVPIPDLVDVHDKFLDGILPNYNGINIPHKETIDWFISLLEKVYYFIPVNQLISMLLVLLIFRNISFFINIVYKVWNSAKVLFKL